jgi:hypothetical protein
LQKGWLFFAILNKDVTMGNQEGMFYPQEQQPIEEHVRKQEEIERVEEDSTWQEPVRDPHAGYEEGYISTFYPGNEQREKIQPQQRRKWKPTARQILTLIAILLLIVAATKFTESIFTLIIPLIVIICYINIRINLVVRPTSVEQSEHRFIVDGQATLVLNNRAGDIEIKRGANHSVEIKSVRTSRGRFARTENAQSDYEQRGDKILVKEQHWGRGAWRSKVTINYTILLPEQSDIHIAQNEGAIGIEGIRGKISISMNAGDVNLKGVNLKGQSVVGLNGGNITINGSLEKGGRTTLRSNIGSIDVTLPAGSAFQFNRHTMLGNVGNQFGNQTLGKPPYAQLEAYTNVGSIHLWKR